MTWWRDGEDYDVFFNRDELKTRLPASPPNLLDTSSGTKYISPSDPVAGGTWMLVNEHRLTVCLLNRWHETIPERENFESRGLLVSSMADAMSADEVMQRLQEIDRAPYKPFTLVAIDPYELRAKAWNGELLSDENSSPPLTSSSYRFSEVAASRAKVFSNLADHELKSLSQYQQGESPASAYTVRMNRPDAQTWSRSHLSVRANGIHWEYIEEEPDLIGEGILHTAELPL